MVQRTCHLYKHAQIRETHWCFKRRQIGIQNRQIFKAINLEDIKCIKKWTKKKTFFYRIKLVELNPMEFQKFCYTHICPYFSTFFSTFWFSFTFQKFSITIWVGTKLGKCTIGVIIMDRIYQSERLVSSKNFPC